MRMSKPAQKRAFWGWAWWAPQVLFAVGTLGFHAWTSVQIRSNDYETAQFRRTMESLNADMREVKVQMAEREELGALRNTAEELGLQAPRPDQIIRLAFNPAAYYAPSQHIDAATSPAGEPAAAPRQSTPQPAFALAQASAPLAAVAPRETGRLTIAREIDAALVPVNDPVVSPGVGASAPGLDASVEQMLDPF